MNGSMHVDCSSKGTLWSKTAFSVLIYEHVQNINRHTVGTAEISSLNAEKTS